MRWAADAWRKDGDGSQRCRVRNFDWSQKQGGSVCLTISGCACTGQVPPALAILPSTAEPFRGTHSA